MRLHVRLVGDLAGCVLDRWRRPRLCARAIRQKSRPHRHRKPGERCVPYDFLAAITLGVA